MESKIQLFQVNRTLPSYGVPQLSLGEPTHLHRALLVLILHNILILMIGLQEQQIAPRENQQNYGVEDGLGNYSGL